MRARYAWLTACTFSAVLFGCVDRAGFVCAIDAECEQFGIVGYCEPSGACSFTDLTCASGRRLGEGAASGRAGACVPTDGTLPDAGVHGPGGPDPGADDAGVHDAGVSMPPLDAALPAFVPSNFSAELLTAGLDGLSIRASDGLVTIDTDTGAIIRYSDGVDLRPAGVLFEIVAQTGAPPIGVFSATFLQIDEGAVVRAEGSAALGFAIDRSAAVYGIIDASGGADSTRYRDPTQPGPGGFRGGDRALSAGAGPGGGHSVAQTGSGGGGGGHLDVGGKGGSRGGSVGGDNGAAYGSPTLTPLVGGSGGGAGGDGAQWGLGGDGGGGGGAVQISARGSILVNATGVIDVGGAGGGGGSANRGGGGGGSGGAILLEAGERVGVFGVLVANGGGGGAGANSVAGGGEGSDGPRAAGQASGGVRPQMSSSGGGGQGGGGGVRRGDDGERGDHGPDGAGGGGGGGGAGGRIHLRSSRIARPGVVSPIGGVSETPAY